MSMQVSEFLYRIKRLTDLKTLYVKGGWGAPLNSYNKKRVINAYTYNAKRADKINAASADTFAFDCCGIVKAVLWGFNEDPSKINGGAVYKSNGVPDLSDAGFQRVCRKISNDWSKIIPGACLFMEGHMGVYIGDGKCVECTPIWKDGVQITRVNNITAKGRGNGRTWNKWGLIPYLDYTEEEDMTKEQTMELIKEELPKMIPQLIRSYMSALGQLPATNDVTEAMIRRVIDSGLMVGDPDGNFRPQSYLKREEFAIVLSQMLPDR